MVLKRQCAVELVPFSCCYVHNSEVNQYFGVENNAAEAAVELGDRKTALSLIV
jgi:hypothetical protein